MTTEELQGQSISVHSLSLTDDNGYRTLTLKVSCNGKDATLCFENVSPFCCSFETSETVIHGFEIIDHSADGWQTDARYEVRDYEEDSIAFYCENITVL
ncbi:MAG: hypothetical protein IJD82_10745 [Clostridia bacterium]|nr:hypothetical protein [Clostridia bacterium]MBQ3004203.1 hypothetical protein [Clostridia bacterium]